MAFARIVDALATGSPFEVYGDGNQSRSFTYVADVVDATIRGLDAPAGAIYNVGGGEESTVREAVALLEEMAGRRLDVSYGPPPAGGPRRATCAGRGRTRPASSATSAGGRRRRSGTGWRRTGPGPPVKSPGGDRPRSRPRRRAGSRPRRPLGVDRGAMVASRRGADR